jgi:hypothetical protein
MTQYKQIRLLRNNDFDRLVLIPNISLPPLVYHEEVIYLHIHSRVYREALPCEMVTAEEEFDVQMRGDYELI